MKNEICATLINPPVLNVQWRKCNSNYFYFKCAGSLFEHSVSEQKIISHKKGHSLYEKDKRPACNLIYTSTNNELWLMGFTVIAGSTVIWEHKLPIHWVLISLYLSAVALMCILDGCTWQKSCCDSWIFEVRVKNPDPVCGSVTSFFWQITYLPFLWVLLSSFLVYAEGKHLCTCIVSKQTESYLVLATTSKYC